MKAVIPAAGIGKRLRPHTYSAPKALLPVAGKPILAHILDQVVCLDVSGVVLIVGYKGDMIEEYVKNGYPGVELVFVHQEERLGIGHAVHLTRKAADTGEPLLMILGDTIIKADLSRMVSVGSNVLGVREVEDPRRFGVCEVAGDRIVKLVEKPEIPPGNLALVGLYYIEDSKLLFECLEDEITGDIKTRGEYQLTDALQMMIERGAEFRPFEIEEWFDCGKTDTLLETNRHLLSQYDSSPGREGALIIPPVAIHDTAVITNSVVGPHVSIGAESIVKDSIVRDSVVGDGAEIVNSLLERSIIGSRAVVRGSFNALNIGDSSVVSIDGEQSTGPVESKEE